MKVNSARTKRFCSKAPSMCDLLGLNRFTPRLVWEDSIYLGRGGSIPVPVDYVLVGGRRNLQQLALLTSKMLRCKPGSLQVGSEGSSVMSLRLWRRAGPWGLMWGGIQAWIIVMTDFGGFFPYNDMNPPPNFPTFYNLTLLSVFGLGAIVGLLLDDPDLGMRAFPVSQFVATLGGFGVLLAGPSNLANAHSLGPFVFAVSATLILFFLSMMGAIVGTFLVGLFEDQFPRSLDWRVLAIASTFGLVPSFWLLLSAGSFDSSGTVLILWGGSLAFPGMILATAAGLVIALYGFIKGGVAPPRTFSMSMLLAALTGGVGLLGFLNAYSAYYGCFAANRIDYRQPPCPLAGDLLNLVVVVGAGMIPSVVVFLGCLLANDAKLAAPDSPERT